jgi:hypothetical protein
MRGLGLAAVLALAAGGMAQAQVQPFFIQPFGLHEAARLDQQRLADQTYVQGLAAAQARLRTQQTLQSLELARPPAPIVPDNYPASSGVRRRSGAEPRQPGAVAEPGAASLPADAGREAICRSERRGG